MTGFRRCLLATYLVAAALAACDDASVDRVSCGAGRAVEVLDQRFCTYDEATVGPTPDIFACPAGVPFKLVLEGAVVCSPRDYTAEQLPDEVCASVSRSCEGDPEDAAVPPTDMHVEPPDAGSVDADAADAVAMDAATIDARPSDAAEPIDAHSIDAAEPLDAFDAIAPDAGSARCDVPWGPVTLDVASMAGDLALALVPRAGADPIVVAGLRTGAAVPMDPTTRPSPTLVTGVVAADGIAGALRSTDLADASFYDGDVRSIALRAEPTGNVVVGLVHRGLAGPFGGNVYAHVRSYRPTSAEPTLLVSEGSGATYDTDFSDLVLQGRAVFLGSGALLRMLWRELAPSEPGTLASFDRAGGYAASSGVVRLADPFVDAAGSNGLLALLSPAAMADVVAWSGTSDAASRLATPSRTTRAALWRAAPSDDHVVAYGEDRSLRVRTLSCTSGCTFDGTGAIAVTSATAIGHVALAGPVTDEPGLEAVAWSEGERVRLRVLSDADDADPYVLRAGLDATRALRDVQLAVAVTETHALYVVGVLSGAPFAPLEATSLELYGVSCARTGSP